MARISDHDRTQSRCLGAAQPRNLRAIAARAESKRRQVDNVVGHDPPNGRVGQFIASPHDLEVSDQEAQRRAAARDRPAKGLIRSKGSEQRTRQCKGDEAAVGQQRARRRSGRREYARTANTADQFLTKLGGRGSTAEQHAERDDVIAATDQRRRDAIVCR